MIKLIDLLENKILVPRRSPEERSKNFLIANQKKIQQYIKDGSKGDLDLSGTPITSLPQGLTVGGFLDLRYTPLSKKYNKEEIKQMVPGVKGQIYIK
jgi:predicted metal-dependent hydrolase